MVRVIFPSGIILEYKEARFIFIEKDATRLFTNEERTNICASIPIVTQCVFDWGQATIMKK